MKRLSVIMIRTSVIMKRLSVIMIKKSVIVHFIVGWLVGFVNCSS